MPPCKRRGWRAAHRSTNSSPNEYRSTDAPIVLFMTCAPLCPGGSQDNRQRGHDHRSQALLGHEGLRCRVARSSAGALGSSAHTVARSNSEWCNAIVECPKLLGRRHHVDHPSEPRISREQIHPFEREDDHRNRVCLMCRRYAGCAGGSAGFRLVVHVSSAGRPVHHGRSSRFSRGPRAMIRAFRKARRPVGTWLDGRFSRAGSANLRLAVRRHRRRMGG